jgi:hypothetical protein
MPVSASSVSASSGLFVDSLSKVLMIDGTDRNSSVTTRSRLDSTKRGTLDSSFMEAGPYVPITGESPTGGDYAHRNRIFSEKLGTADSTDSAWQHYFTTEKSSRSREHKSTRTHSHDSYPSWDLDRDNRHHEHEFNDRRHDDRIPPTSAVPLPAAMWLFGSGLLGLIVARMRQHKFPMNE